jgi:hypothetical protein
MLMERLWAYFKKEVKQEAAGISHNPLAQVQFLDQFLHSVPCALVFFKGWRMHPLFII